MLVNCVVRFVFFFFKQKTAYEMRISDWSSDVCSSDLGWPPPPHSSANSCSRAAPSPSPRRAAGGHGPASRRRRACRAVLSRWRKSRSEEHTSELQSLMRISYAVFCLKKKNKKKEQQMKAKMSQQRT